MILVNFKDTLLSAELIIETNEVPLIVGKSGIGKTALAKELAKKKQWELIVIDGNLLKEGEIGGLPTIEDFDYVYEDAVIRKKRTVYAVHTKLQEIDKLLALNKEVLLFIDELNRCEHTVQQELMNLILNREINGYILKKEVKILAAMNPSNKYGEDFDYQVVDMDSAQENRFVWLYMESDAKGWLDWAIENDIEERVIEFISTFPEYLHSGDNEDYVKATPRSFERVSKVYKIYKDNKSTIPKRILSNIIKGNLGNKITQEFIAFIEEERKPLISFEEVFMEKELSLEVINKIKRENHTRLYVTAKNILSMLNSFEENENFIERLVDFINHYPIDLKLGIMKDIKENYNNIYNKCLQNNNFVNIYFQAYSEVKG